MYSLVVLRFRFLTSIVCKMLTYYMSFFTVAMVVFFLSGKTRVSCRVGAVYKTWSWEAVFLCVFVCFLCVCLSRKRHGRV